MMNSNTIKVFIIDDSLVFNRFLANALPLSNPSIQIAGSAMNAFDALNKIPAAAPDVITLDVEMPGMDGITFLGELLPKHLLPVILVSSLNVNVFDALSRGAVDFVKKPDMTGDYKPQDFVQKLAAKIFIASRARVRLPHSPAAKAPAVKGAPDSLSAVLPNPPAGRVKSPLAYSAKTRDLPNPIFPKSSHLIALGASTGGTEATLQILKELPPNTPGMVITQHMPEGFTAMYAQRLDRLCPMEVREAKDGDLIRQGLALVAPGGALQTKVVRTGNQYRVTCRPGEKVNGHRPSVDVLFHSAAEAAGSEAIGILLTGMGRDGAEGLLHMRQKGAYTIGQDKDSCVVYGMPMEARQIGAVCMQAACQDIAGLLIKYLKK